MNLRIAHYVVALAISLAAFAGAYGYASPSARLEATEHEAAVQALMAAMRRSDKEDLRAGRENGSSATEIAAFDAAVAEAAKARASANDDTANDAYAAYGFASAVSVAAFAGAYILDKRRTPPEG